VAVALAGGLAASHFAHGSARARRNQTSEVDAHLFVPGPEAARILALGHTELAADLLWTRTLIYYGDGLYHETGIPDAEKLVLLVNRLDPQFRRAYIWGAHAMPFRRKFATEDEYRASVDVLRRGVAIFPDDWELNWLLGLRLALDLKSGSAEEVRRRKEEGAGYIERAMRLPGAPPDLPILAASVRTGLGQKERALRELREMILNTEDEKARLQLKERYARMVSDVASHELVTAAEAFDRGWKADLPYVPRTLYIQIGPKSPPSLDISPLGADGTSFAEEIAP
jgi:hypothetical protein